MRNPESIPACFWYHADFLPGHAAGIPVDVLPAFVGLVRSGLAIYEHSRRRFGSLVRSGLAISRIDCLQLGGLSVLDFSYFGMPALICAACPLRTCLL